MSPGNSHLTIVDPSTFSSLRGFNSILNVTFHIVLSIDLLLFNLGYNVSESLHCSANRHALVNLPPALASVEDNVIESLMAKMNR